MAKAVNTPPSPTIAQLEAETHAALERAKVLLAEAEETRKSVDKHSGAGPMPMYRQKQTRAQVDALHAQRRAMRTGVMVTIMSTITADITYNSNECVPDVLTAKDREPVVKQNHIEYKDPFGGAVRLKANQKTQIPIEFLARDIFIFLLEKGLISQVVEPPVTSMVT